MNSDTIAGEWKQFVGKAREKWGKLTDSDWETIGGKKDQLVGKIQERYGMTREQAQRDFDDYNRAMDSTDRPATRTSSSKL